MASCQREIVELNDDTKSGLLIGRLNHVRPRPIPMLVGLRGQMIGVHSTEQAEIFQDDLIRVFLWLGAKGVRRMCIFGHGLILKRKQPLTSYMCNDKKAEDEERKN